MKIRIADRLLVALAGLVILALVAGVVAQMFFQVPVTDLAAKALTSSNPTYRYIVIGAAVVLLILGVYCFLLLFRHRKGHRGYIQQPVEGGQVDVSLKVLESYVLKCVDRHPEMALQSISLVPGKDDAVIVRLKIGVASNVSIPLAVAALQKQVSTYVNECSGVEVKEVRIQVENTTEGVAKTPYIVSDLTGLQPLLEGEAPAEEKPAAPVTETVPVQEEAPAEEPEAPAAEETAPAEEEAAPAETEAAPAGEETPAEEVPAETVEEAAAPAEEAAENEETPKEDD